MKKREKIILVIRFFKLNFPYHILFMNDTELKLS